MSDDAKKSVFGVCEEQMHRPAYASTQSDQHMYCSLIGKSMLFHVGLNLTLSETPKTVFSWVAANISITIIITIEKEAAIGVINLRALTVF